MAWCVVENMPPVKHGASPPGERDTAREMAHLVRPDARYHASYLAAHDELVRESADGQAARDGDGDWQQAPDPTTGFAGLSFTRESLEDPAEFRRLVAARRAEELPETPTRSGHEFLAHCSEDDFARARFPQKLARKCTALLELWRAEASGRGNRQGAPGSGVDGFGAPRGIPMIPPSAGPGG